MKNENRLPDNYKELYKIFCDDADYGFQIDDGRFMAYDKCRDAFEKYCDNKLDDEIMALHLYAFLSSWGMTTHIQYLMRKNYICLFNVAKALKQYHDEWAKFSHDFCPDKNKADEEESYIKTVLAMKTAIIKALNNNCGETLPKGASNVLINKIIMVTYGCIPAFDSYIRAEWENLGFQKFSSRGKDWLNRSLLEELYEYVSDNRKELLELPSENRYSVFKKLDMILWGKHEQENKRKN